MVDSNSTDMDSILVGSGNIDRIIHNYDDWDAAAQTAKTMKRKNKARNTSVFRAL